MLDIDEIHAGNRKALAKAITLLESTRSDHRDQAEHLLQQAAPLSGNSIRIGLTGAPGVGKSTMVEILGNQVIEQGHKIAVLAVDPSSKLSGGSILGDKTRMPTLAVNQHAFIRPTPAGESLGGVARRTRESIILCEAAGFDVIIVETVGVGQSETLVSEMTDLFVLMLLPSGGDELQGIKRGIMELADIVVINKADGEMQTRANLAAADVKQALRMIKPRYPQWQVPVLTVSAQQNMNVSLLWQEIVNFKSCLQKEDKIQWSRQQQAKNWLWQETRELLLERLKNDSDIQSSLQTLQQQVADGQVPPSIAANKIVTKFFN